MYCTTIVAQGDLLHTHVSYQVQPLGPCGLKSWVVPSSCFAVVLNGTLAVATPQVFLAYPCIIILPARLFMQTCAWRPQHAVSMIVIFFLYDDVLALGQAFFGGAFLPCSWCSIVLSGWYWRQSMHSNISFDFAPVNYVAQS